MLNNIELDFSSKDEGVLQEITDLLEKVNTIKDIIEPRRINHNCRISIRYSLGYVHSEQFRFSLYQEKGIIRLLSNNAHNCSVISFAE
ncbi:hypothetical protein D1872_216270 [compost metagenome]